MEFKALGHSTFRKLAKDINSIPHYAWQVSVEMIATGLPCYLILVDKDKSNIDDQSSYTIFTKLIKELSILQGRYHQTDICYRGSGKG